MTSINKTFLIETKTLTDRQIRVVVSTNAIDREGDQIVQAGIDLSNYLKNPVVLFNHDYDQPIAKCESIGVVNGQLEALVQFPPEGASPRSDEIYNLIKAGVLNAVSIGFMVAEQEPVEGSKFGRRFMRTECLEFSVVSVPCNPEALIVGRSFRVNDTKRLTVKQPARWDGKAAAERLLKAAGIGTAHPNYPKARRGFLVVDESRKNEPAAYQIPIGDINDHGKLFAVRQALVAAKAKLKTLDVPDEVKKQAEAVLAGYTGEMEKSMPKAKSLLDVCTLADILYDLGWLEEYLEWDEEWAVENGAEPSAALAEIEAAVATLASALRLLVEEETAEMIAEEAAEEAKTVASDETVTKSGAVLSTKNIGAVKDAMKALDDLMTCHGKAYGTLTKMLEDAGAEVVPVPEGDGNAQLPTGDLSTAVSTASTETPKLKAARELLEQLKAKK